MPHLQQDRKHDIILNDTIPFGPGRAMAEFVAKHSLINFAASQARTFNPMDPRSVCLFLGMKELSAAGIPREFVGVFGSHATAYSTVTKYPRSASFEVKGTGSDEGPGDRGIHVTGSDFSVA
jgi:hypothetical protein